MNLKCREASTWNSPLKEVERDFRRQLPPFQSHRAIRVQKAVCPTSLLLWSWPAGQLWILLATIVDCRVERGSDGTSPRCARCDELCLMRFLVPGRELRSLT